MSKLIEFKPKVYRRNSISIPDTLPIEASASDVNDIMQVQEHDAEAITNRADIDKIVSYLLNSKRYRDAMLFVIGINVGLRYSDLVSLRFKNIIDENRQFIEDVCLVERKTRETRGRKKGETKGKPRNRHLYLNEAVRKIVKIYLDNNKACLDDYLFYNQSHNYTEIGKPLSHTAVDKIFKTLTKKLGIEGRHSTHFLRKTFSYHFLLATPPTPIGGQVVDGRRIEWLQKTLGHSDLMTTFEYAGYTKVEVKGFYNSLNLGIEAIDKYIETQKEEVG